MGDSFTRFRPKFRSNRGAAASSPSLGRPMSASPPFVNALVGSKVTIVSPKVQTTRAIIRGIAIEGDAQLIFVDTPGIFAPRRRLDRAMVAMAWSGAHDAISSP